MGTVYLAEQREPIRRLVALKVIKLGMDTSQVLARFVNERQALAIMDHPNIARIFDAGATRKGRPYFVMEYIEGSPITHYCDRKRIGVSERLGLFRGVCSAVHHAHQKGVIHRDLKPSNVLVVESEGAPLPKVIDFGIAKATDQWAIENTLLTQFGQVIGTPEYASPEQADAVTGAVDGISDVYSLGVLLYELLTGTTPFDSARMRQVGLSEMLRIIREEDAPTPSVKLAAMEKPALDGIAALRDTDAASLRREVDGDLNWITAKALEKSRERRYASVADLAADIRRHLEHRPVLASPPSRIYRIRKFARRRRTVVLGGAAGLAFLALSALTVWSFARHPSPSRPTIAAKATIVLTDFSNTTGDPGFNGIRQAISVGLEKSPYLSLLPDARVSQTLRLMLRPPDTRLTPDVASEICERTGSMAVVEGSITGLGNQYVLSLRARNCRTGDVLDEEQSPAANKDGVFRALGQMTDRFRARVESLPPAEKTPSLPDEATTPSLEAWRSYSAAMKALQTKGTEPVEAIPLLKRAIEIDPQFASAYADLGRVYASLGESELSAQNITKAYELRNRVSARENFEITFNYHRQVTRNLELARQTLESWVQQYPGEFTPHGFLAAFTTQGSGRYQKAAEEGEKAIALDPDYAIGYHNTAFAYIYQGKLPEAEAVLRKAAIRKIETVELSTCRYMVAMLRNDRAALERERTQGQTKLEAQGWFENQEALTLAYEGRLREAARLSERAVSLSRQSGLPERGALFEGARAAWSSLFEMHADAQKEAEAALSLYRSRDADYGPGFALALLGEFAPAHKIEAGLGQQYPDDTSVQFSYLPALRALEALGKGDPAKAVELTQVAAPYDYAVPGTAFYSGALFGALYPVYVRGLAFSRMGHHREAADEFQKIVDHPYITLNDPIGPMARLRLARELAAAGDRARSAAVYRDLLAIWKDADADIPLVQEARAEAAKLP